MKKVGRRCFEEGRSEFGSKKATSLLRPKGVLWIVRVGGFHFMKRILLLLYEFHLLYTHFQHISALWQAAHINLLRCFTCQNLLSEQVGDAEIL